ncbi:AAA family ATPase [Streptomyces sp. NPDC091271]|uniref:AAA family ATPase n=1 Tax=Streptomyces sp. NPDC091271 TaxID=3365980 RepID=UPI00381D4A97
MTDEEAAPLAQGARMLEAGLLGRGAQWAVLAAAVERVREGHGGAVWVRGQPGIGKTVLLGQAGELAAARGLRLLRVTGSEAEKDVPFAALHQLAWPLLQQSRKSRDTASPGLAALEAALGLTSDDTPAYAVATATWDLLTSAARDRPVVVLVDDLHWIDASSADVLHVVQRRLADVPVLVLATIRDDAWPGLDDTGVCVAALGPLGDSGAAALLDVSHTGLPADARARILREAAGNPLALVELPTQLAAGHRDGHFPLPEQLPLSERLERIFAGWVRGLAHETRFVLLLCALAGHGEPAVRLVGSVADAAGADAVAAHLAAAERRKVVSVDPRTGRVRFRHPLVRSALVRSAPGVERRRAHAAWAAVLAEGEVRQVTHLAEATAVPDETVALALEKVARATESRGGFTEAARLHARAASLSDSAPARSRRLVAAAFAAAQGSQVALASQLLGEARAQGVRAQDRNLFDYTCAQVRLHTEGDFGPILALLPRVLDQLTADEAPLRLPGLFLLLLAAGFTSEPSAWQAVAARLGDAPEIVALGYDAWNDPARRAHGGAERLARLVAAGPADRAAPELWLLLFAASGLGVVGEQAELWQWAARRYPGATEALIEAASAHDDYLSGNWDRCVERSGAAAAQARAKGSVFNERVHGYKAGYVVAARGERMAVEAFVAEVEPWAVDRGLTMIRHRLRAMRAMCALALGDYEGAYAHAAVLTPPGTLPADVSQFHLVFLDLVEAAVHTGRSVEARRHVEAGRAARMGLISPHHAFVLLAAEAVVAEDVDAACEAVYAADGERWPFELARVHHHHGAWLRRHGRRAEARARLLTAHRLFADLGAGPWLERTAEELRVANRLKAVEPAPLTPQELRIAGLVAHGLSNRDIGERLRVSPRTVASHLYKIYPKLGISSRAAVAKAMAPRRTAPADPGPPRRVITPVGRSSGGAGLPEAAGAPVSPPPEPRREPPAS